MHAVALFLALSTQVQVDAITGVRVENRTGRRPLVVGGEDALVTEFEVVPDLGLDFAFKRSTFAISYSPRAYSRFNLQGSNTIERPLFLHNFGVGFNHRFSPRTRFNIGASGS